MSRLALPVNYAMPGAAEEMLLNAWVVSANFEYGATGSSDAVEQFNGNNTAKLEYSATNNDARCDAKNLSDPARSIYGFYYKNKTARVLGISVLTAVTPWSSYGETYITLPPTGDNWRLMWWTPQNGTNAAAFYPGGFWWKTDSRYTITQFRFRQNTTSIAHAWQAGDVVNIGPIVTRQIRQRPKIMIHHDDGYSNVYANRSWIADRGLMSTVPIYPSKIGAATYMTWDQIDDLYSLGWDIANHSNNEEFLFVGETYGINTSDANITHDGVSTVTLEILEGIHNIKTGHIITIGSGNYAGNQIVTSVSGQFVTYSKSYIGAPSPSVVSVSANSNSNGMQAFTKQQCIDSISACTDELNSRGYTRASMHFAHPLGWQHEDLLSALQETGIKSARLTMPSSQTVFTDSFCWPGHDNGNLLNQTFAFMQQASVGGLDLGSNPLVYGGVINCDPPTPTAEIIRSIDNSIANGMPIVCLAHTLGTGDKAHHDVWLDYLVSLLDQGLADTVTVSEWFSGITGLRIDAAGRIAA